jgi:hypothetical protein
MVLAGCGGGGDAPEGPLVWGELDYAVAGETTRDWAENGDELAVVDVRDESTPKPWPAYKDNGGLAGRKITMKVGRPLWIRPGAPRAPHDLKIQTLGWMWENDQDPHSARRVIYEDGAPRMEPGKRYLVVLTRFHGEWGPVSGRAVLTVGSDGRAHADPPYGEPSPGAREVDDRTPKQAAAVLARLVPPAGEQEQALSAGSP